ncbi:MAG TPA: glyoxalase [Sphingomonas sp.]|nr:glyoxalase [Sphingomonas sp.]
MPVQPFHLAFLVHDLAAVRAVHGGLLGCWQGRGLERWIDFDLHGHQIVVPLDPMPPPAGPTGRVDGDDMPGPHFGIAPHVRSAGQAGEQAMMFCRDCPGNALELKTFRDQLFAGA